MLPTMDEQTMMIMFDDNEIDMYRSIFNILYNMEIAQEVALSIMHDITRYYYDSACTKWKLPRPPGLC